MKNRWLIPFFAVLAACGGASASDDVGAAPEADLTKTSIEAGSFDLLGRPGDVLGSFECQHYFSLRLYNGPKGATAQFDPQIKNCDGEEEPRSSDPDIYVLKEVSKDACGGRVLEGTVPWGGAVTRTLRITDNRKACEKGSARIIAEDLRTLRGETNSVAKYYSADQ